jgi:YVTN family beta-propeller protein
LVASCGRRAPFTYPGLAFVASEGSKAISVVDLQRFSVRKQIPMPHAPTMVLAHPEQPRVWALAASSGTVHEINTGSLSLNRQLKVGTTAFSMVLDREAKSLWVLADQKIARVNLSDLRMDAEFSLPSPASYFDVSPWLGFAAASHPDQGAVTLIDVENRSFNRQVKLGGRPESVRFRSDGNMLLVADTAGRMLTSLKMPEGRVVSSLPLAVRPDHFCFNQDNGQLFITGEGADAAVVVFPYPFPQVAETVLAGSDPGAMGAGATHLFVANPKAGDVSILDVASRKVIAVAPVGVEPSAITVTPNNGFALVLNRKSGDMAVIRIGTIRTERDKRTSVLTLIPVGSNPLSVAVSEAKA